MGIPKSLGLHGFVKVLFEQLFVDLQQRWPEISKSLCRDKQTLVSRLDAEGLSFCTKTLPRLGKDLDHALDSGTLVPNLAFKKAKGSQTIPAFLQGMFSVLFDPSGRLVGENAAMVADLRQLLYLVYKLELPYSPEDESRVIETFLDTEKELSELDLSSTDMSAEASLISEVLQSFDPKDITPRHGPGAVATGERLEKKWVFSRLYQGIHQAYPYYEYFMVGGSRELLDRLEWYKSLKRENVGVAKVVLVPKDSRGPRLISCEPLEYQWIQQGLNQKLVQHLESHKLTKGHINFKDQSINQELALESSKHHFFCTLDLKDASDRVSLQLVRKLFPESFVRYLEAVRSHATLLPDGRVVPLCKYAPMGSAMCFSIEAFCFWAICVVAVAKRFSWDLREAAQQVYVYGDDLVVPTIAYDAVVSALESAGLKVNIQKCCSMGDFRESCGVDAFKGINVTPTKISTCWSDEPSSGACLASYASYANSLEQKGYFATASHIRNQLRRVHRILPAGTVRAGYPCVQVGSIGEACRINNAAGIPSRYNEAFQKVEFRVKCLIPKRTASTLDSWLRLLRNECSGSGERPDEVVHPRSTQVRWRWRSAS